MSARFLVVALLALPTFSQAAENRMNPIRKVVSLLQAMQKKVTEEGDRETELYKKFMCYCKKSGGSLKDGIVANEESSASLATEVKAAAEEKASTAEDLERAQNDRAAAKKSMAEATEIRQKEAEAFAAEKGSAESDVKAVLAAVASLEKGMSGSFIQTTNAERLRKLVSAKQDMLEVDRQDVLAFLSDDSSYAPQSGEIVGILKQMADEMHKGLQEAIKAEEAAIQDYEALMSAKSKEVEALTASIEKKMKKIGELSVKIARMNNELQDTAESLAADKEFLANLEKNCATKTAEWEVIKQTRSEELVALADTIKVLSDDDALELFKKTLPSGASLLQLQQGASSVRARALHALKDSSLKRPQMDIIMLALHGKKIGFGAVVDMIDKMVASLKAEQTDDDNKKTFCGVQLDQADDKKKAQAKDLSDTEASIASTKEAIATLADEIAALTAEIKNLDESVAEATAQRKQEHEDFKAVMASDAAAKELLGWAKNRLNKFYNPKLFKAPPKVELSAEDRMFVNNGGTPPPTEAPGGIAGTGIAVLAQVTAHDQSKVAPPPAPEAPGAYKKKSEETSGVLHMIDLLVQDLDKEMTEAQTSEKDAQADYEQLTADSSEKRKSDSALLTQKTASKSSLEVDLQESKDAKASLSKELQATHAYIAQLHTECDWLLQYFDVRKTARATEIDALGKAKAVLSGADYSLLQGNVKRSLRKSA